MGAHGWVAGICQPWGQFFYLGAGWPQWKPLGIPGTHLPLKRGSWLIHDFNLNVQILTLQVCISIPRNSQTESDLHEGVSRGTGMPL